MKERERERERDYQLISISLLDEFPISVRLDSPGRHLCPVYAEREEGDAADRKGKRVSYIMRCCLALADV